MIAKKGQPAPGKFWTSGRPLHPTRDASLGYVEAEREQFAVDTGSTPGGVLRYHLRTPRKFRSPGRLPSARVYAAIENAECMLRYHEDPQQGLLIDALQVQAALGPEQAVMFLRSIFKVEKDLAVGSFLQAAGFLPGSHLLGCWQHNRNSVVTQEKGESSSNFDGP